MGRVMSEVPVIAEVERGLTHRAVELEEQFLHGLRARVVCFMGEGPGLDDALIVADLQRADLRTR